MLGRKAILHTAAAGKRKWQLEQEEADLDDSSQQESEVDSLDEDDKGDRDGDAKPDTGHKDSEEKDKTEKGLQPSVRPGPGSDVQEPVVSARKEEEEEQKEEGKDGEGDQEDLHATATGAGGAGAGTGTGGGEPAPEEPKADAKTEAEGTGEGKDEEKEEEDDDDEDGSGSGGGQKRKRFAWMDSEDEVSEGGDEEEGTLGKATAGMGAGTGAVASAKSPGIAGAGTPNGGAGVAHPPSAAPAPGARALDTAPFPPLPPTHVNISASTLAGPLPPMPMPLAVPTGRIPPGTGAAAAGGACAGAGASAGVAAGAVGLQTPLLPSMRPGALRPSLRPPPVLPPGTRLPRLTQEHLALMAQISVSRSVDSLWELVEKHGDNFAAAHAATSLHRLALLSAGAAFTGAGAGPGAGMLPDQRLEKNTAFVKLSNRVDELLATADGRATFLPADLAMVVSALAKVVQLPVKEGALGRIFADVADEVEARLSVEPAAFTPPMLGDIAWAVARSGETVNGVAKAIISPAMRRFFGAVIEVAHPKLAEMTCQDLANLAAAYADATREDADGLLKGIFAQTQQRLAYHPPPTNALFSTGQGGGPANSLTVPLRPAMAVPLRPAAASTFTAPATAPAAGGGGNAVQAQEERAPPWQQSGQWKFTGGQISEIALAVAKHINLYEPGLFDLVATQFLQRLQEFTTDQLRRLRDAFDIVRHDRDFEFIKSMKVVLKQREVRRGCKSYRLGNCKFGDRCVYSHDD